jgi:hypothetical protein
MFKIVSVSVVNWDYVDMGPFEIDLMHNNGLFHISGC